MDESLNPAGILLVDKPQGISSAKAIARVKAGAPWIKKIGHAGTLDPLATGLLVCLINSATRLASYAEQGRKVYSGTIRFGMRSTTDDVDGELELTGGTVPEFPEIETVASEFKGVIEQVPPAVSAVKVNGVRSYKLSRKGQAVELKPRKVSIYSFVLVPHSAEEVGFTIECSKGTYVRSIARDLGEVLGCGGVLSSLRREGSWPFDVESACEIGEFSAEDLVGWEALFPSALEVQLSGSQVEKLSNGDQRAIAAIGQQIGRLYCEQIAGQNLQTQLCSSVAVCMDEESGQAAGIFVRRGEDHWQFGVNIMHASSTSRC